MNLGDLSPPRGSTKRPKRVGRGRGSGRGKTCGRGTKGQKSRSGRKPRLGFEGGQMPLIRRIPKRGFRKTKEVVLTPVNLDSLSKFNENEEITEELLIKEGIIKRRETPKILGRGKVNIPLKIKIPRISDGAIRKIEACGGKVIRDV